MANLKVWWKSNLVDLKIPVASPDAAVVTLKGLADADLGNPDVVWNAGGLIDLDDNGYEWYSDDEETLGMDIREYEDWLDEQNTMNLAASADLPTEPVHEAPAAAAKAERAVKLTPKQDETLQELISIADIGKKGGGFHWDIGTPALRDALVKKGMIVYDKYANGETNRKGLTLTDAGRAYAIERGWLEAAKPAPRPAIGTPVIMGDNHGGVTSGIIVDADTEGARAISMDRNVMIIDNTPAENVQGQATKLTIGQSAYAIIDGWVTQVKVAEYATGEYQVTWVEDGMVKSTWFEMDFVYATKSEAQLQQHANEISAPTTAPAKSADGDAAVSDEYTPQYIEASAINPKFQDVKFEDICEQIYLKDRYGSTVSSYDYNRAVVAAQHAIQRKGIENEDLQATITALRSQLAAARGALSEIRDMSNILNFTLSDASKCASQALSGLAATDASGG